MSAGAAPAFARLIEVIAELREHCPWMAALTHHTLVEYLIEESYELVEAIEDGHASEEVAGELGDVLLQVVLHARLAEEAGSFDIADVARGLTAKMIRRNPHVFRPDGSLQETFPATVEEIVDRWHAVKKQEQPARTSPFAGIPHALPALALAAKTVERAGRTEVPEAGKLRVRAEAADDAEAAGYAAAARSFAPATEEDLGTLLFEIVRQAAAQGLDAERALRAAVVRYQRDFTHDANDAR